MSDAYEALIDRKMAQAHSSGFNVPPEKLGAHLFPHQRDLVGWALRRGRAAVFADTGLGKGLMLLDWARIVAGDFGRVIIAAPLAVGPQLEEEAKRFGVAARYCRDDSAKHEIAITNYEMLHRFDAREFAGVVLDESSILKAIDGKTRALMTEMFAATEWKLCCTATPAPNDVTELGQHSEFLGVKTRAEMLAEYFAHDGGSTQDWRVKGHAVDAFWRWLATWGAVVRLPSDLGHADDGFVLPPLEMVDYVVETTNDLKASLGHENAIANALGLTKSMTLGDQRAARRATIDARVKLAAERVRAHAAEGLQSIVWCELNAEQDALADELGGLCVSIEGATPDDLKEQMLGYWKRGTVTCLVSKCAIFGFGLNLQNCSRVIFLGASHSFERTYQAIRRCWRFGQTRSVRVEMIRSDLDAAVSDNYRRKERDHQRMQSAMHELVGAAVRAEVCGATHSYNPYVPTKEMELPKWIT